MNELRQGRDTPVGVPLQEGPAAVEAWFAAAGLAVTVVGRCPDGRCRSCSHLLSAA